MAEKKISKVPTDTEYYIQATKERASQGGQNLEKLKRLRADDVAETYSEIEKLKAQKMLEDLKKGIYTPSTTVISQVFAGKTPDQINQILQNMTPEAQHNLVALAGRLDSNAVQIAPTPQSTTESTILTMLLKYILEGKDRQQPQQPQKSPTEIALEILKTIREFERPAQSAPPSQQQGNPLQNTFELIKTVQDLQRPFYDAMNKSQKEVYDARLREMEAKMPSSFEESIKYVKEMAPMLGFGSKQASELDLRLEEMRQNREVDMKKLEWEQRRYEMEQDSDNQKWEQIARILQGPLGRAIQGLGDAGADRVRGRGTGNSRMPKPVQTQCPSCAKTIFVDENADTAVCSYCGSILQKPSAPIAQPAPPPEPTPAPEEAEQQPAQAEEEEETVEEETEDGRAEETDTEAKQ